ncbi:hypothetical protein R6Q59_029374 [Mikania micrantha]
MADVSSPFFTLYYHQQHQHTLNPSIAITTDMVAEEANKAEVQHKTHTEVEEL